MCGWADSLARACVRVTCHAALQDQPRREGAQRCPGLHRVPNRHTRGLACLKHEWPKGGFAVLLVCSPSRNRNTARPTRGLARGEVAIAAAQKQEYFWAPLCLSSLDCWETAQQPQHQMARMSPMRLPSMLYFSLILPLCVVGRETTGQRRRQERPQVPGETAPTGEEEEAKQTVQDAAVAVVRSGVLVTDVEAATEVSGAARRDWNEQTNSWSVRSVITCLRLRLVS